VSRGHSAAGWLRCLGPWRVRGPAAQRLGLLLCATLVWDLVLVLDGRLPPGWSGAAVLATVVIYPVLGVVCALALRQPIPPWLRSWGPERVLVGAPVVALLAVLVVGLQVPSLLRSRAGIGADVTATTVCAARDVLAGRDPYATGEAACLHRLHAPVTIATPLQRGPFQGVLHYPSAAALRRAEALAVRDHGRSSAFPQFGYPPMSFVFMLPVARAPRAAWIAWTMAAALAWLLVAGRASGTLWPATVMCLLLQFGGGSVLGAATQGDGEFFAYALATLALLLLDRPRLSGALLALAAATNPLIWLVVPGYLVLGLRLSRWRGRLGWFAATLLLAVGPWLLVDRNAAGAIFALVRQPAYAFGIGLISELGAAPSPALRSVLLGVEGAALLLLVAGCGLRPRWRFVAPAVSVAVLWVAWRSDANYLAQLFPLAVATTVGVHRLTGRTPPGKPTGGSPAVAPAGAAAP